MATLTKAERITAVLTALDATNAAPTPARVTRIIDAYGSMYGQALLPGVDPATYTVSQKRGVLLRAMNRFVREVVQAAEANAAAEAARKAALVAVDTEWGEEEGV